MRRLKSGLHQVTVDLEAEQEYQFGYMVNGQAWYIDEQADRYVPNPFGGNNSVVVT